MLFYVRKLESFIIFENVHIFDGGVISSVNIKVALYDTSIVILITDNILMLLGHLEGKKTTKIFQQRNIVCKTYAI